MPDLHPILSKLAHGLIVSCQSSPPLSGPQFAGPIAQAAVLLAQVFDESSLTAIKQAMPHGGRSIG